MLAKGTCSGGIEKSSLSGIRLRFGEVIEEGWEGENHAAFGVVEYDEPVSTLNCVLLNSHSQSVKLCMFSVII